MKYKCPKCGRWGIEWDGRAKVLRCHWNRCQHIICIDKDSYDGTPSEAQIEAAIKGVVPQSSDNNVHITARDGSDKIVARCSRIPADTSDIVKEAEACLELSKNYHQNKDLWILEPYRNHITALIAENAHLRDKNKRIARAAENNISDKNSDSLNVNLRCIAEELRKD